jgi:hypothetical protein
MTTQSALWGKVRSGGISTLAVMGMTKNTGKTVALNHLLACADADKVAVGVTSIGRDGEARDQVFQFPKPPVTVWPGMLIATARDTLSRAKVSTRPVCATGLDSPMGEIVIVRALEHGEMEIAGASRSTDLLALIAQLKTCGCDLVVLDGALGRSHHASPAVADAVVLATGAAIGGGIQDVIRKTRDRLSILGVPQADSALHALTASVFAAGGIGVWNKQNQCLFQSGISTLNAAPTLMEYAPTDIKTIAVSGAVGRKLWAALMELVAQKPGLTLVVHDGTRLFVDAPELATFARLSGQVLAHQGIRIAGVTVNPFAPQGGHFDAHLLLQAARDAFAPYEVTDVVLENAVQPCTTAM